MDSSFPSLGTTGALIYCLTTVDVSAENHSDLQRAAVDGGLLFSDLQRWQFRSRVFFGRILWPGLGMSWGKERRQKMLQECDWRSFSLLWSSVHNEFPTFCFFQNVLVCLLVCFFGASGMVKLACPGMVSCPFRSWSFNCPSSVVF